MGKIEEYQYRGEPIAISRLGHLRSHLSSGAELVALAVADAYLIETNNTSREDVWAVQHIIESHHGEYGSVVQPKCAEAVIVHLADLCSARLRVLADGIESSPMDAASWVQPAGWKRDPIWHFPSALKASGRTRRMSEVPFPDPTDTDLTETHTMVLSGEGGPYDSDFLGASDSRAISADGGLAVRAHGA